jgi:NADH-quinone oxidoreductase subunit G
VSREVTIVIDGREVQAVDGEMLHDAAKRGDVEIPVFCYEPKLGDPVGACRMCLVEVEGIPKLQTSCSTPVRDGMVIHTRTDQVKQAQNAVVEFLLVNHPLDCPVCDKGGECPLQDISMGWGPGKSRFTDDKRHFEKPIELSPLVALDRERCILCYRCVRFSQEVSEDAQLQLLERGDRTYVGTFDERPYVGPFHGNVTDLCPVGALTNYTYRFRARPWDIEQGGSVCTLCPSQCNLSFTVRDEQVKRVLARDNPEVDDGWLCDRGRYGFEMFGAPERVTEPRLRGGAAAPWPDAIAAAAEGLRKAGPVAALVGDASNEEGYLLQRIMREALRSQAIDSRPGHGVSRSTAVQLSEPALSIKARDIDRAGAILILGTDPLHSMSILDLRIRKAMRRHGARLVVATERPTSLDGGAAVVERVLPGGDASFLPGVIESLRGGPASGPKPEVADVLRDAESVVVIYGGSYAEGETHAGQLLTIAAELGFAGREGSGFLEVPATTNGRGLREVGCIPDAGPGLLRVELQENLHEWRLQGSWTTETIRRGLEEGEVSGLVVFGVDPLRDFPNTPAWEAAIGAADFVVSFSMFENATTAKSDVVFPLESHAEKDGTVTHPDGRLQRVRPGASRPGDIRPGWGVLAELSLALGHDTGIDSQPSAFAAVSEAVPFYAGITDAELGGRGARWQERGAAAAFPGGGVDGTTSADATPRDSEQISAEGAGAARTVSAEAAPSTPSANGGGGKLMLATYRDLWVGPITELNPPLRFLQPSQTLEISPADAERLGLQTGDEVRVSNEHGGVGARVAVRERMRDGHCFLIAGTATDNANALADIGVSLVEVAKHERVGA